MDHNVYTSYHCRIRGWCVLWLYIKFNVHTIVIPIIVTKAVPICCSRVVPLEYTGSEYVYMPFSICGILAAKTITSFKPEFSARKIVMVPVQQAWK